MQFTSFEGFVDSLRIGFDTSDSAIVVRVNAMNSGDTWVAIDLDSSGDFSSSDSLIVLTGISSQTQIAASDFLS